MAVIVVPALTHSTPYTILTSSMVPTYPPGTLVIVKPIPIDDIHIGTVVTYQLESGKPELVTHRVVAINQPNVPGGEPTFVTKGDANDVPDEMPVQYLQIRGAVWYSVPYVGWINNLVNGDTRSVLIPIIAGALFLYAGYQFVTGRLERKRERRELAASKETPGEVSTEAADDAPDEAPKQAEPTDA